ncbi:hypothetical protein CMQ_5326 [Grosmannia clavigera kw1407]|uniref:Uncharacterized protein n=1 Tax=Grosmannia clavigera (strain kw1407 / UAMH 11150) TaxID=655863 RepID=F0XB40_GROCL|nr:uncharacterized protein CMQ_5326 [Grosmannia clavigera kw1407]EFX05064.1 hypothetical protein CMQ_5326 [Grosmannia clavigera kw1407]
MVTNKLTRKTEIVAQTSPDLSGLDDCNSYLLQTATVSTWNSATVTILAPPVTSTHYETDMVLVSGTNYVDIYVTLTSYDTTIPVTTEWDSWTSWKTDTEIDYLATSTITTTVTESSLPSLSSSAAVYKRNVRRSAKTIPVYASACTATKEYSSLCLCAGATLATTTVTPAASTITQTKTPTVTQTVHSVVESTDTTLQTRVWTVTEVWVDASYRPTMTTTYWVSTVDVTTFVSTTAVSSTETLTITVTILE